jgi:hypothetical protein
VDECKVGPCLKASTMRMPSPAFAAAGASGSSSSFDEGSSLPASFPTVEDFEGLDAEEKLDVCDDADAIVEKLEAGTRDRGPHTHFAPVKISVAVVGTTITWYVPVKLSEYWCMRCQL